MAIVNSDYTDIVNKDFRSLKVTVGNTEVLAVSAGAALEDRERLVIINTGNKDIYIGPTGVASNGVNEGDILSPNDRYVFDRLGPDINIYMITQGPSSSALVWEFS